MLLKGQVTLAKISIKLQCK